MTPDTTPDSRIIWPDGCSPKLSWVFAKNTIDINALPERVWSHLIDCTKWPSWYKHCSDVSILEGESVLGPGSKFRFKTIGNVFEPQVSHFDRPYMLTWLAKGPFGTYGAHAWLIEATSTGCRVITEEAQCGFMLAPLRGRLRRTLLEVHDEWLVGLKRLSEQPAVS